MSKKSNLYILIAAVCLLLVGASVIYLSYKPYVNNSQNVEKNSAPDFELKDTDGKTVKLSDYKGNVVVLNFWATWCGYCTEELPDFNELDNRLKQNNKNVTLLAIDVGEKKDKVKSYLANNHLTLRVLLDENGDVSQKYNVTGIPVTVIIDKDGAIFDRISGITDQNTVIGILNGME